MKLEFFQHHFVNENRQFTQKAKNSAGFTLIEILIAIAIISILAVSVFVALDPITRFQEARNSTRINDVNSILTAIHSYIVDNDGALPTGLSTSMSATELGTGGLNLSAPLVKYLKTIPIGPSGSEAATNYTVAVDSNNIVTVAAENAENSAVISVSR